MDEGTSESAFAALLRELKDRSGLSYGTLAKRLHMSTSTLHRYCNGDAVPTDYAPVERLARLCRATPEELVELHRRWVLADAGRGRKGQEPARAVREPAVEAGVPEPAAGQETGPVSAAVPAAAPEPEPQPEPEAGPKPQQEQEQEQEQEHEQAAASEPASASVRDKAAGPWRRRRTVLLAALAVTALLGGVTAALSLPSSGDGTQDVGAKGGTASAGTAARGGAPVTPTAGSPTPRRSATRSASASPTAEPSASAAGSGAPAATPSRAPAGGATSAAPPLTVNTHPYSWEDPCSQHYLIDRPPAEVSPPPLEQDAPAWVDVHRAVSAGDQFVTFTVQGTGPETVVLEGLSVRMAGKRSPLQWNDYAMGYPGVGCGGGVPTHSFSVALDAMRPAPVPAAGSRNFPFKVSQSEPEVFHITADASAYDVSWNLELQWSSGTRHGTLLIDDAGRPFRTSGNNGRPAYAFPLGGEKWQPASDTN
ncbi:helix-turn-helix domain-containing protein [Streptomyces echinatus]|uniref:Transcriptional regulator with XRE-family HTH domain n=1 Tax=Streptomyces echinatus TaxID=67293 RepID=A0A7W9UQ65_9ACTN|nr:helix-turn-helix transcriptional regulator [Streptomyces echinatus]MBB5927090.1 transcriptional regulator with XRE-family HTH domain [Streptomyces echinatus]